jgi:hypothetical protein
LAGVTNNPVFRMAIYQRHKELGNWSSVLAGFVGVGVGALFLSGGVFNWLVFALILAGGAFLTLELAERPGRLTRRRKDLAGLSMLPRDAMLDLEFSGYRPVDMALGLWASTQSRILSRLRGFMVAAGIAVCLIGVVVFARGGEPEAFGWLWLAALFYFIVRGVVTFAAPEHTLRSSLSLLQAGRVWWRRRHDPAGALGHALLAFGRYVFFFLFFIGVAAVTGFSVVFLVDSFAYDLQWPDDLYRAAALAVLLGIVTGMMIARILRGRRERLLLRLADLLAWLIAADRAVAAGESPPTLAAMASRRESADSRKAKTDRQSTTGSA